MFNTLGLMGPLGMSVGYQRYLVGTQSYKHPTPGSPNIRNAGFWKKAHFASMPPGIFGHKLFPAVAMEAVLDCILHTFGIRGSVVIRGKCKSKTISGSSYAIRT